ncbi:uncharacterized protein [Penaeus vannamei]
MPYPQNLETAVEVEQIIRKEGAVPATIAILRGQVHVGLSAVELETLAEKKEPCVKTSRRDFPFVLAKGLNGGTTVSGTMLVAHHAGIPVFVTGGIGGVHRGAENTLDISADLTELGRTPVAVVSAGVKSILDVEKTLEYLETQGVCVSVLGSDNRFPDFFTRDSGCKAPCHVETPLMAAHMMNKWQEMKINSGMLIAVPIPEEHQAEGKLIKEAIDIAVKEAELAVSGREVTPFILQRVFEITGGQSLKSNIALIKNNAKAGAQIAVELARLKSSTSSFLPPTDSPTKKSGTSEQGRPVVVGGSIVDFIATVMEPEIKFSGMTHRGHIRQSYGGVGRNIGDALARLGCRPLLISAVGDDTHARALTAHNPKLELGGLARVGGASTAVYCVVLDQAGEALFGVGDMSVHERVTPGHVSQFEDEICCSPLVILDGNMPLSTIGYVLDLCSSCGVPVWYEPTDIQKASKPWQSGRGDKVTFSSPNLSELRSIWRHLGLSELPPSNHATEGEDLTDILGAIVHTATPLLDTMSALMVTLGPQGFMILRKASPEKSNDPLLPVLRAPHSSDGIIGLHFPGQKNPNVISVSGAGDCLAAGFIAGMLQGHGLSECSALGLHAASLSLEASPAVPDTLCTSVLPWGQHQSYKIVS